MSSSLLSQLYSHLCVPGNQKYNHNTKGNLNNNNTTLMEETFPDPVKVKYIILFRFSPLTLFKNDNT